MNKALVRCTIARTRYITKKIKGSKRWGNKNLAVSATDDDREVGFQPRELSPNITVIFLRGKISDRIQMDMTYLLQTPTAHVLC